MAKLEAAGWLGRAPGMWGEGSVAWLTARGLGGAGLDGLRPVKVPPRPSTVAHAVLVGWAAARVQRRGRPWRSARELALDADQWAIRVRDERGPSRYRLPDLAVWLHASKPPLALVVNAGLARADRQRSILKGWRDAIHAGHYLGVRYECTTASVADRVAYLAEKVHLAHPEFLATAQPQRNEILKLGSASPESELLPLPTDQADDNRSEAAERVQLSLLAPPALAPVDVPDHEWAPKQDEPQPPDSRFAITTEERERRYRELLGVEDGKRRWPARR